MRPDFLPTRIEQPGLWRLKHPLSILARINLHAFSSSRQNRPLSLRSPSVALRERQENPNRCDKESLHKTIV